jgi:hypothetical protein
MKNAHQSPQLHLMISPPERWTRVFRALVLSLASFLFLNTLYYVVRTANPVIRSDGWYFLDVFVRKVFDGTLTFGDFFVKRAGADHAQPLFKLLMLGELRFFDLDFTVESIVGLFSAAACVAILWKIVATTFRSEHRDFARYLAWLAMSAIFFSLKSYDTWTWPLVSLGYLSMVPMLLFVVAAWQSWNRGRYVWLVAITLLLGIIDDDGAIMVVAATLGAIALVLLCDPVQRRREAWITLAVVIGCTLAVRVGYSFAIVSDGPPNQPLSSYMHILSGLVISEGARWISIPLALSVLPPDAPHSMHVVTWHALQWLVAGLLVIAHLWFWCHALKRDCNLAKFSAICLMLLFYAWLAGILVYRVPEYGTSYFYQDRYVQLYQFNLIALLLMWTSIFQFEALQSLWRRRIATIIPVLACLLLIGLQIPYTRAAWYQRRFLVTYYHAMAVRLIQLADEPARTDGCEPELSVCGYPLDERRELLKILTDNQLNVFSLRVRQWHPFLRNLPIEKPQAQGH